MLKLLDRLLMVVAGAIVGSSIGSLILGPALALVFPGQYAPRYFPTQQTHYERHVLNITSTGFQADSAQNVCVWVSSTCSVRIGAVPYNAFIARAYFDVTTACNSNTTCTLSIGTTSGGAQLVSAQNIFTGVAAGLITGTVVASTGAIISTGNNIAATGADGGFDLFATVAWTTTAPSAGTVVLVIEYFGANDGGCSNVPIASTAGPC